MAKQSWKEQMYQQIANSQVQQVMQQQRAQQLQNDFANWQKQQNDIAQLQASFNEWKAAQPAAEAPAQPTREIPSIKSIQPQRDLQAEAQEYFAKVRAERRKEEQKAAFINRLSGIGDKVNEALLPKEVEALSTIGETRTPTVKPDNAVDYSARYSAAPQINKGARGGEAWNKSVNDTLNMLNSKDMKNINAYQKLVQANVEEAAKEPEQATPTINSGINQLDLSQYNLPSENGFTEQEQKAFDDYAKALAWADPNYRMTKEEQKEARRIAAEGKQALAEKYPVENKADFGKLYERMSPEDQAKYRTYDDLSLKSDPLAVASVGAADKAVNMLGGALDTVAFFHPEAIRAAKDYKELQKKWNEAKEDTATEAIAKSATPLAENVPLIGEITPYGVGQTATQIGAYALTNNVFDEAGAALLGDKLGRLGGFIGNQVGQNAQDIALDTIPRYQELKAQGKSDEEIRNTLIEEGLWNFGGNLFMGALGEIPTLAKSVSDSKAAKAASDAAFRQNVSEGAEKLAQLANIEDIDNAVRTAARQADEATQNIENIARQMPEVPESQPVNPGTKYNPDYKGVPVEYNDRFVEPEALVHKLTGEKVSPEYAAAVRKLESGEGITSEEYNAIPEIIDAKKRAGSVEDQTINDKSFERVKKREMWLDQLYDNSGSAVRTTVDGKTKTVYNGIVRRDKRADIILGLPSSGKSSAIVDPISYKYKSRLIDSDEAKKLIDEFDDGWGAGRVHVESGDIADRLLARAILNDENVVIPKVGKNYDSMAELIKDLKTNKYKVYLHFNELDPNKAAGRNMRRFANDGRFLDLDRTSFSYGNKPSEVFERLVKEGKVDGYTRVSNDVRMGENPVQLKGTEDISFNWGDNRPGGSEYSKELGEVYRGRAPETGAVSDTTPINGGNDYGTAVNGTGDQGSLRPQESVTSGQEVSGSMDGTGTISPENGGASNLRNVVDESLSKKMDEAGVNNFGLKDTSDNPQLFSEQLAAAKESNPNGRMVSNQSVEDLAGAKIFSDDSNTCGVAIKPDGDIVGVHKNSSNKTKGAVDDMLITARANGGTKLDCYGSGLVSKYERDGFIPVAQVEWNEKFRPDDWGDNPPETVYVMMRDNRTNEQVLEDIKNGSFETSKPEDLEKLPMFSIAEYGDDAYDEALKYRDKLLEMNLQTFAEKQPGTTASFDGVGKERGQSVHVRGNGKMKMEGVSEEVAADFEKNPDMYNVLRNADTKAKAEKIYNESDNPEIEFRDLLAKKDPAALPLGHQIAKDYSAAGNYEAAAQIYRDMGKGLTEAGQFSQAAIINMVKDDPMTAFEYALREIDSLNKSGADRFGKKWKNFKLTTEEKKAFKNIKPGDTEAIKSLYESIGNRLGKEYPTTLMEKLIEARRVAMLFNPRTNVRNFGANPPTLAMRWMSDRVEALGQNAAHLVNKDIKVTQSLYGSGLRGRKMAKEVWNSEQVQALFKGSGSKADIPNLKSSLMENKQVFKGNAVEKWIDKITNNGIQRANEKFFGKKGVQSFLETVRNATYKLLDLGDTPFVKENFVERLGSYISAAKIKNVDNIPDEAIQMAWEEAMKATYKDDSTFVRGLRKLKTGIQDIGNSAAPGLGDAVSQAAIPYLQAPGNIAQRMVDYSAVGATKGISSIIKGARGGDVKLVEKGIAEASKGLTGTGLVLLGMRLRQSGVLTGTYSENKRQREFEKMNGFKEFAIHAGDKYFTYGWAQPFAQELMVGTLLADAIEKSDEYDSDILNYFGIEGSTAGKALGVAKAGSKAAVNSWFNESPLSGLADFFKGNSYSNTDIAGNIWENGVEDFASALVPSVVSATAKVADPVKRNTYDPSNAFATFVNSNAAKLPGLSKKLPAKYDAWGRVMKYAESKGAAAASKYLIPGEYSYDKADEIDSEINRLFNEGVDKDGKLLKDNGVFPTMAPNKVGDKTLNNKEVSEYQKDMGQRSRKAVEAFITSDGYKNLPDAEKVEVLKGIYGASSAITKRDKFDTPLPENSSYKKVIAAYDEAGGGEKGAQAIADYYTQKKIADASGLDSDSKAYKEIEKDLAKGDTAAAEQKIDVAQQLTDAGIGVDGYNVYQARKSNISNIDGWITEYKNIDSLGNSDGFVNQDEFIAAIKKNNWSETEAVRQSKIYGNWKQIPYLKKDGTWGFHKTK